MVFLGWDRPVLHAAADWLLEEHHVAEAPDLSGLLIVVRGRRAGRRLLDLLALKCADRGKILIPPEILTPARLSQRLTESRSGELIEAPPLASALAWAQAIRALGEQDRVRLFRLPGDERTEPGLRALLGMGQHLNRIWEEVGGAGLTFQDVIKVITERFPTIAEFEAPRWEVLDQLHRKALRILRSQGLEDHTTLMIERARSGALISNRRVILVGVAEMPGIVRHLLGRLPEKPVPLVFAPESEREGFDELGTLQAAHWENRSAQLESGEIHLVERDRDQARRAAQILQAWRDQGIDASQMAVAAPETAALARLREAAEILGIKTRWAQGRPTSDAPIFQFLKRVADYLHREADEPPRYEAVAALARHPDVSGIDSADWSALDRFAITHLPARFDPASVTDVSNRVWKITETLNRLVDIAPDEVPSAEAADWTMRLLQRVYGEREENANSPDGRVTVQALELLREALADTTSGRMAWPEKVRPADFLHVLLNFLGEEPVPEPPAPDVVEIVGWLELLEDDAPAAIVTSFHEGAVPEAISGDPFLPGSLRQALDLGDNAMRLARDAYALTVIRHSRSGGRGGIALIAPRFDAADNPVRPSRLLLNGLRNDELAQRVWQLAGRRSSERQESRNDGPGFPAAILPAYPKIERVRVTAFRDYIASPRRFFFQHVLGLKADHDEVLELENRDAGTLMHEVLAAFGSNIDLREATDETSISAFLKETFDEISKNRFGPWVQPAVEIQLEEIRRRLLGFPRVQAALRQEGWTIRYVESNNTLRYDLPSAENQGPLTVIGKIDRIDCDASGQKWRIIDYKSSAKKKDPLAQHRRGRKGTGDWTDLQLPLYLKLAAPYAQQEWGVELTPDNCELVYFQLPEDEGTAGISTPFPAPMVEEGWKKAAELATHILKGEFNENPDFPGDPSRHEPALLALCGKTGLLEARRDGTEAVTLPEGA